MGTCWAPSKGRDKYPGGLGCCLHHTVPASSTPCWGMQGPLGPGTQSGTRWGLIKSQQACGPPATPVTQLVLLSPSSSGHALLPGETSLQSTLRCPPPRVPARSEA